MAQLEKSSANIDSTNKSLSVNGEQDKSTYMTSSQQTEVTWQLAAQVMDGVLFRTYLLIVILACIFTQLALVA